jgi:hypothetical protein
MPWLSSILAQHPAQLPALLGHATAACTADTNYPWQPGRATEGVNDNTKSPRNCPRMPPLGISLPSTILPAPRYKNFMRHEPSCMGCLSPAIQSRSASLHQLPLPAQLMHPPFVRPGATPRATSEKQNDCRTRKKQWHARIHGGVICIGWQVWWRGEGGRRGKGATGGAGRKGEGTGGKREMGKST